MLTFRALEPTDVDLLYVVENEEGQWSYANVTAPYSRFTLEQYVLNATNDFYADNQLRLVAVQDGKCVGLADIFNYDARSQRAEVGIIILPEHRGNGLGADVLKMLIGYAQRNLNLHQLYAHVAADNHLAIKSFLKAGFEHTATLAEWLCTKRGCFVDVEVFQYKL